MPTGEHHHRLHHRCPMDENIRDEAYHQSSGNHHGFSAVRVPFNADSPSAEPYSLDEIVYRSLSEDFLGVSHDLDALKKYNGQYLRFPFDSRVGKITWPYNSGIWSKKERIHSKIDSYDIVNAFEVNHGG